MGIGDGVGDALPVRRGLAWSGVFKGANPILHAQCTPQRFSWRRHVDAGESQEDEMKRQARGLYFRMVVKP